MPDDDDNTTVNSNLTIIDNIYISAKKLYICVVNSLAELCFQCHMTCKTELEVVQKNSVLLVFLRIHSFGTALTVSVSMIKTGKGHCGVQNCWEVKPDNKHYCEQDSHSNDRSKFQYFVITFHH